ncbi:hypothetical protein [Aeromicrobium sp. 179-A 4D2 NHS]|uniref:hypothetical protein n=1 Tax=Aeromicrobium sp. 179-A 4D2 NHS TaxID=3142375 RepID=UPI0039A0B932
MREQSYTDYCTSIEAYNTRLAEHQNTLDEFATRVTTEPVADLATALVSVNHDYEFLPVPDYDTWFFEDATGNIPIFDAVRLGPA